MSFNGVISGGMNVPAFQVDSFIVKAERRILGPDGIFILDGKCRTVTPVEKVAGDFIGIVPFLDQVFKR